MDVFASLGGLLGYVLPFLFVLTIVVFFHELGHFWVARRAGVRVLTFSVGFGPELFGFDDRHGTRWKLSAIPLGGYVRFYGDENAASVPDTDAIQRMTADERRSSFFHKPVSVRALVVAAGPIANFLLAVVIFAGIFTFHGKQVTAARVDIVQPDSAAAKAGFRPGDLVLEIDGRRIDSFADMQRVVGASAGTPLEVVVDRDGVRTTLVATPELREIRDNFGNVHRVGVLGLSRSTAPGDVTTERYNPLVATWMGVQETWFITERTLAYVAGVITGRDSTDQLGGPIRIAQVSGQVAAVGLVALLHLAAVLSVSIGLLNLFPIPLLDGGHLVFYAIEAVRGRPLSERAQELSFRVGLAIVLMLMLVATWNDILHLTGS